MPTALLFLFNTAERPFTPLTVRLCGFQYTLVIINFCFFCGLVANVSFREKNNELFLCDFVVNFSLIETDCVILSVDCSAPMPLPSYSQSCNYDELLQLRKSGRILLLSLHFLTSSYTWHSVETY